MKNWLYVWSGAALCAGFLLQAPDAAEVECPDPVEIVIYQPAELICCGSTTSTTYTQITTKCSGVAAYVTPGKPMLDAKCVTTTLPWTGTVTDTVTIPSHGRAPGTKIVKVPGGNPECITTTIAWTGTLTETETIPASGTAPSTVIVKSPCERPDYVTKTIPWTGTITTTATVSPHRGKPGIIAIKTPPPRRRPRLCHFYNFLDWKHNSHLYETS
ncbi:60s ribosomal l19 [Trichoderma arundinaceum]|uniref:60s ribosomal l19 n=1 Tax=Trichoderma arundinaceum TaxID=490622 RepID=A0A395NMU5_TRIAR|nr:60s ribosomal l19 [Trichoderma arundinaceum]